MPARGSRRRRLRQRRAEAIVFTTVWEPVASPPLPLRPDLLEAVKRHTDELWPGAVVLPVMSRGATDGLHLRNVGIPTCGVEGVFRDPNDVQAYGRDERIGIKAFYGAREFLYRLVKTLGSRETTPVTHRLGSWRIPGESETMG